MPDILIISIVWFNIYGSLCRSLAIMPIWPQIMHPSGFPVRPFSLLSLSLRSEKGRSVCHPANCRLCPAGRPVRHQKIIIRLATKGLYYSDCVVVCSVSFAVDFELASQTPTLLVGQIFLLIFYNNFLTRNYESASPRAKNA